MDTKSSKTDSRDLPQRERKHPEEWAGDLEPDHMAGQNIGEMAAEREKGLPTAYDVKEVHRSLRGFTDDDLKSIPVLPEGSRLQQGATYLDLSDARREEFTATGDMEAESGKRYVPKDEVPYPIWNRLRGIEDPERL